MLNSLKVSSIDGQNALEASFSIRNVNALQADLHNGAALNLTLDLALEKPHTLLPNESMDKRTLFYQLRFDPLTREYVLLTLAAPPQRNRQLGPLLESLLGDTVIPLTPQTAFEQGQTYRASLTLAVRYADVPPWLKKTLFFWSWDAMAPATFTLNFQYKGGNATPGALHD